MNVSKISSFGSVNYSFKSKKSAQKPVDAQTKSNVHASDSIDARNMRRLAAICIASLAAATSAISNPVKSENSSQNNSTYNSTWCTDAPCYFDDEDVPEAEVEEINENTPGFYDVAPDHYDPDVPLNVQYHPNSSNNNSGKSTSGTSSDNSRELDPTTIDSFDFCYYYPETCKTYSERKQQIQRQNNAPNTIRMYRIG